MLKSTSSNSQSIQINEGILSVPDHPILPFIEGDGSGPDIWRAAQPVLDAAIEKAYHGKKHIHWLEVYAGQKAFDRTGQYLPDETVQAFRDYRVGIKGPLATPVGGGIRSLNVALRRALDLYICQRPVRWFHGVPSPVKHPEAVDMVVFRENTEDLYAGIEFEHGTLENSLFMQTFHTSFPAEYEKMRFPTTSGIGIKPVSKEGSQRLVRAAIRWTLEHHRRNLTLVHKGNIMKYTEGAFRNWGYELAEKEFVDQVYTQQQWERTRLAQGDDIANAEKETALSRGKLFIKDIITDAAFEQTLTRPQEFDVLATTNLNGDYLSEALTAQVGGVGMAPGANINAETGAAIFEATHGTAPTLAGKNMANPGSVILSGEMLLRYMGWFEAADRIIQGIQGAISAKTVTFDLHAQMEKDSGNTGNAHLLTTSEYSQAIIQHMA